MFKKLLLTGFMVALLIACAVSPTGRKQFLMLSSQQVDAMGVQAFQDLKRAKPIVTNRGANAYVNCVAQAITNELQNQERLWEVVVIRDKSANAFALPGGKIGVHTGLLKVARTQDQLAAVIGHEVGHVLAQHANERLSQEFAVQGGLSLAGALASRNMEARNYQNLMRALGLGTQVGVLLPYSRIHESEADVIGLDLMARAGFDPRQSLVLWQNMSEAGGGRPPEFLSTHPSHGTRIGNLSARMDSALGTYRSARAQGKKPRCGRR